MNMMLASSKQEKSAKTSLEINRKKFLFLGIDVIARSVIAQSTTLRERTGAMSHMSIAQGVGFSCGPGNFYILSYSKFI